MYSSNDRDTRADSCANRNRRAVLNPITSQVSGSVAKSLGYFPMMSEISAGSLNLPEYGSMIALPGATSRYWRKNIVLPQTVRASGIIRTPPDSVRPDRRPGRFHFGSQYGWRSNTISPDGNLAVYRPASPVIIEVSCRNSPILGSCRRIIS